MTELDLTPIKQRLEASRWNNQYLNVFVDHAYDDIAALIAEIERLHERIFDLQCDLRDAL